MKKNVLNLITLVSLGATLLVLSLLFVFRAKDDVSYSERRALKQFPKLSLATVLSGEFMTDFETFALDQFPFRENFRTVKALWQFSVLFQSDNNGIYVAENSVSSIEYPLNESSVLSAASKLNALYDLYLKNSNCKVYYSVIPDKNYFLARAHGYPAMDYPRLVELFTSTVQNMEHIDIFPALSASDYYRTDPHWRQEALTEVVAALALQMGFEPETSYTYETLSGFYGAYYGQSALPIAAETLTILHSPAIDSATVTNYESGEITTVYDYEGYSGMDSYDIFLHGASPLMTIENPHSQSDAELIIFRDSFGSSLAPLLLDSYAKITLVDIRYISSAYVGEFVTFTDQDVLFIYSTTILNNSASLKD
ncbi:MAG: DHHW family protein [Clostridia bacterium]|nr:DHHW family protein [Clostridia bacterium]